MTRERANAATNARTQESRRLMELGTRMKAARRSHGLTLREVATRTGLSVSFLSNIERGRSEPSLSSCRKLADVYGAEALGLNHITQESERNMEHRIKSMGDEIERLNQRISKDLATITSLQKENAALRTIVGDHARLFLRWEEGKIRAESSEDS